MIKLRLKLLRFLAISSTLRMVERMRMLKIQIFPLRMQVKT